MALHFKKQTNTYVPDWENNRELPPEEQISVVVKTLTFKDTIEFQSESVGKINPKFLEDMNSPEAGIALWGPMEFVLLKYTSEYKNIFDEEGHPISEPGPLIERFGNTHSGLFADIFNHIITVSNLSGADRKNSVSDSDQGNSESSTIVEAA